MTKSREALSTNNEFLNNLRHPDQSFADVAEYLGVFDKSDVRAYHQNCIEAHFDSRMSYEKRLLPVVMAFEQAYSSTIDTLKIQGLGFCLADIHLRTEHYYECMHELMAIKRRFMERGATDHELIRYVTDAIHDIVPLTNPVVSSTLLVGKDRHS